MSPSDLTARLDAAQRAADVFALWPDLSPRTLAAVYRRLADLTGAVLRGDAAPRVELGGIGERELGAVASLSGVGTLLAYWIETGRISADAPVARVLAAHLDHGRRRAAMLGGRLVELLDTFAARGLTPILLKGTDTAYRYFPDPGTRPRADIDLLVAAGEVGDARAALQAAGYTEYRRTRHAARSEWRHADAPRTVHSLDMEHVANPWSVDLHVALERWYFRGLRAGFGFPREEQLSPWAYEGHSARALAQPLLTAFLALHASYGMTDFRPLRAVELALVLRHDGANGVLRWEALAELLERTGTARFVYPALELTERWVPGTVDPEVRVLLRRAATPRARRVVDQVETQGFRLAHRSLDDKLMWAKGPAEWLGNLSDLLWSADDQITAGYQLRLYLRRVRMLLTGRSRLRAGPRAEG
jgi:hypothetical protein